MAGFITYEAVRVSREDMASDFRGIPLGHHKRRDVIMFQLYRCNDVFFHSELSAKERVPSCRDCAEEGERYLLYPRDFLSVAQGHLCVV